MQPATPVRIVSAYARSEEEVAMFRDAAAEVAPAGHLEWAEALEAVGTVFCLVVACFGDVLGCMGRVCIAVP